MSVPADFAAVTPAGRLTLMPRAFHFDRRARRGGRFGNAVRIGHEGGGRLWCNKCNCNAEGSINASTNKIFPHAPSPRKHRAGAITRSEFVSSDALVVQ